MRPCPNAFCGRQPILMGNATDFQYGCPEGHFYGTPGWNEREAAANWNDEVMNGSMNSSRFARKVW